MRPRIIVFRVDASLEIGTGHVMRCLTLAEALRERGCECHFISREHPGNLSDLVSEREFTVHNLPATDITQEIEYELDSPAHTAWLGTNWKTDAAQVRSVIRDMAVDWLVVDHYALDANWERELRSVCRKILIIDDLADRQHNCDLLLDQNLVKDWQSRYNSVVPENCGLMLGPEYGLLHPIYAELHDRVPPREGPVRRILVYFGGADSDSLTGMVVSAFKSLRRDDIMLDVVISPASPHIDSIRRQVAENQRICLHEHLPTLASLIVKADLAVGAGGATSWERCCLGLPTLVITLAENQRPIAEELGRLGLVRYLGHKDAIGETVIAQELQRILESGISPDWSTRCRKLVDGQGVERVADVVLLNSQTPLKARLARRDDEKILLAWANDPLVRKNAFNTEQINAETHRKWFYDRLRDLDHCRIFILETGNGLPVGQVRFDHSPSGWVVSYSLDPCARGRGLGKQLLQVAMLAFRESVKHATILARVKDFNIRSRKVLNRIGFTHEDQGEGELVYRRLL
jgi:UDP-2,4-diacetamido-2,4,6-trideoxy-beta-L-altropyranose hydrolase